jgi:hypothetical protein
MGMGSGFGAAPQQTRACERTLMGIDGSSGTSREPSQLSSARLRIFFWEDQYPCLRKASVGVSRNSYLSGWRKRR